MTALLSFFLLACGGKDPQPTTDPDVNTAPPVPEEKVEPEPVPEPEEVIPEEPMVESNIDLNLTLTMADGSTKKGKVIRVERNKKYNGLEEWLDKESKLSIDLIRGKEYKTVTFNDLTKITIKPEGKGLNDSDCNFESNYEPLMYFCKQPTISKAFLTDGTSWQIDNLYKWKFYFEDKSEMELWLSTHRVLEQEEFSGSIGDNSVNNELIAKLKQKMVDELNSTHIVRIDFE